MVEMISDPEGEYPGKHRISFRDALDKGIVRHPTVALFLEEPMISSSKLELMEVRLGLGTLVRKWHIMHRIVGTVRF